MNQDLVRSSPMYALARILSQVFHPFIVVIPTMVIAIYATTGNWLSAIGWSFLCVGFVIAPAILYIRRKLKRKEYTDGDISVREHRFGIYAFAGVCELLCLTTLLIFGAPKILIACFLAAILALVLGTLFNTQTKISVHMAAMGGCTAVLLYVTPVLGTFMLGASVAVGWARIYLGQHTMGQVVIGYVISIVSVLFVFALAQMWLPLR